MTKEKEDFFKTPKREVDTRESVKVVVTNTFIEGKVSRDMDVNAQKFLRLCIAQCRMHDDQFWGYEVSATELADMFGVSLSNIYHHVDRWTDQAMEAKLILKEYGAKKFRKYNLFGSCWYEDGILRMKMNEDMKPLILQIRKEQGFTQYELSNIVTMKGKYSIRIYEMIQKEMRQLSPYGQKTVKVVLQLDEIRNQTNTEKQYEKLSAFKSYVLNKAQLEIEKAMNWKIVRNDIKKGRSVTGFEFEIWSQVGFNVSLTPEKQLEVEKRCRKLELVKKKRNGVITPDEDDELQELILELDQMSLDFTKL